MISIIAGAWMYYLQVYHFYEPVQAETISLTSVASNEAEEIIVDDIQAIDAESSPIRFRACFTTPMSHGLLTEAYVLYEEAVPLTAPGWFDCFDADALGEALEDGTALAFLGEKNIEYGVDRIVVIHEDGRGFAWHQLNNCGRKAYDGSPVGEACPPRGSQ